VPTKVSNTQEGFELSQENTWDILPLVSQPAKQEQTVDPSGEITYQNPRKKRITATRQERLAIVTPLSKDNPLARGENDPALCHEQNTGEGISSPADVSSVSLQQTLSPAEIERICRAFIRLIIAPVAQPDDKEGRESTTLM
jgi:hypothetical protein